MTSLTSPGIDMSILSLAEERVKPHNRELVITYHIYYLCFYPLVVEVA